MLNGVIDSREVRRAKATEPSQSSRTATHHGSRQDAAADARLQEVIPQRDAYYQSWMTSHQKTISNHYANLFREQMQVQLSRFPLLLRHWTTHNIYQIHTRHVSKNRVLGVLFTFGKKNPTYESKLEDNTWSL